MVDPLVQTGKHFLNEKCIPDMEWPILTMSGSSNNGERSSIESHTPSANGSMTYSFSRLDFSCMRHVLCVNFDGLYASKSNASSVTFSLCNSSAHSLILSAVSTSTHGDTTWLSFSRVGGDILDKSAPSNCLKSNVSMSSRMHFPG